MLNVSVGQKLILCAYYIQDVKGRIQLQVYKINKERVMHFSQLIQKSSENFEEISSSISRKIKKMETYAK